MTQADIPTEQGRYFCQSLQCDWVFDASLLGIYNRLIEAHYQEHHPDEPIPYRKRGYAVSYSPYPKPVGEFKLLEGEWLAAFSRAWEGHWSLDSYWLPWERVFSTKEAAIKDAFQRHRKEIEEYQEKAHGLQLALLAFMEQSL